MRVYLFGPMRNYEHFNFPAFADATTRLQAAGHDVFSPAARDLEAGFDPAGNGTDAELTEKGLDLREALSRNLGWICAHAEALAGLPAWRSSPGSLAEVHTARALRLPVYELDAFLSGAGEIQWSDFR